MQKCWKIIICKNIIRNGYLNTPGELTSELVGEIQFASCLACKVISPLIALNTSLISAP